MDYLTAFNQSPKNLLRLIPRDKKVIVFVDEIQYLKNPSNFLKYFYDEHRENIKLIVSGSSAFYIDSNRC
jgi:predicted AAA+ superfamily ATPase